MSDRPQATDAGPADPDAGLRWPSAILHVDMDAFFVAVEQRRDPSLRGRPVVVGGSGPRGVVAAASYEARAYGVHSAMPSVRARRLCPQALFLPAQHQLYAEASARIMALFAEITPLVEPLSLDEAFLDVTGAQRRLGPPAEIAGRLRRRVHDAEQLTCSVGVATTKFLAKLASEAAKPTPTPTGPRPGRGVFVVEPGHELAFLHPLPVRALWGVGPATLSRLERLGVATVGDLAALPLAALVAAVGDASGRHLYELAHNRDPRAVEPDREVKSIGHEETFAADRFDRAELDRELLRLGDAVARRLRDANVAAATVTIKVRFGDFTTITRSQRQPEPVDSALAITRAARSLLDRVDVSPGVRLIGVSTSGLAPLDHRQLQLDLDLDRRPAAAAPPAAGDAPAVAAASRADQVRRAALRRDPAAWQEANDTVDAIRRRFGAAAIGPGALAAAGGRLEVFQRGQRAWGPLAEDEYAGRAEHADTAVDADTAGPAAVTDADEDLRRGRSRGGPRSEVHQAPRPR